MTNLVPETLHTLEHNSGTTDLFVCDTDPRAPFIPLSATPTRALRLSRSAQLGLGGRKKKNTFFFFGTKSIEMLRDLWRDDCGRDCDKLQEKLGNDESHIDCNKQQEKLFSRCKRFSHCRTFLLTLSSAVLCNIVVRPAMSAPIRKDKSIWGDGSLRDGSASSARWGKGEGGVPTKDELHKMFPPIPINVSVSPVVLVPGIGGSIMTVNEGVNTGLQVWIRLYEATYYFQRYMWGRFNDTTKVPYLLNSCLTT